MICLLPIASVSVMYISNALQGFGVDYTFSYLVANLSFTIFLLLPLPHTTEQGLLMSVGKIFVSLVSDQ
jgi:hypothetical protein